MAFESAGTAYTPLPDTTALGALARHLTESRAKRFQPTNINYGLCSRSCREGCAVPIVAAPTPSAPGRPSRPGRSTTRLQLPLSIRDRAS